jgi:hypothetical protein
MNSHYKLGLGNESKASYGSSYGSWSPHKPQEKSSKALKIIVITGVCIAVIMTLIVFIDPLSPSLFTGALNYSFAVGNGLNPNPQAIYIVSSHREVDWSAVADAAWLKLDPLDGRTDKETPITLSVDISGMYPGEYAATVTIFANAAKNTPLEILVSLIITDTKETLAIKKAVGGETDNLEVYYDKQPLYSGINLINSQSAMNPTWGQLLQFIGSDDTDEQTYIEGVYMCGSFAETLHNNAEQEGIRVAWVVIDFADSTIGHALNAFNTIDQGIVFVDCTAGGFEVFAPSLEDSRSYESDYDKIAYIKIGSEYGLITAELAESGEYRFYEQYEQRWENYESSVEEYNARVEEYNTSVEEYNRRVKEYNREVSTGTYEYGRMMVMYLDLQQEETRLKREEEDLKREADYLNQLVQDLGYYPWKSLGVVSHVEVYW